MEVDVRLVDSRGSGRQVSTDGGVRPKWSEQGDRLFCKPGKELLFIHSGALGTAFPTQWGNHPGSARDERNRS